MSISFKRIVKFGWQSFTRNRGLSLQVLLVMAIALFIVTSFFFSRGIGLLLIQEVEKKVDVAVYFKKEVSEKSMLQIKDELKQFSSELEKVEYVSSQDALSNFEEKHKNDPLYLSALEEVEDNPFLPSLTIKARQPQEYAQIASFLETSVFTNLIERVSYNQNKEVIEKLFSIISMAQVIGIGLVIIFSLLVVLITFNTIKLTILSQKQEITTSRLVGASNWFIRGPFIVQGILYGLFAILLVDVIFFSGILLLNQKLATWFLNFNATGYLFSNFVLIILIQLASALALGSISSTIAVRKYLRI